MKNSTLTIVNQLLMFFIEWKISEMKCNKMQ